MLREADPSPPVGPDRDALAAAAAARVEVAEQTMMTSANVYAARVRGVVLARLQGPKARKHTRHWQNPNRLTQVAMAAQQYAGEAAATGLYSKADSKDARPANLQLKELDPEYIVPDSLIGEGVEAMRSAAERVATESATDAAERITAGGDSGEGGMFEVDQNLLADLIDEALEDMLGAAERYAASLREAILEGEAADLPLDDLVQNVEEAADKGGNWMRLSARTIGTALAGKAVLEQARALGVTHTQWISRRDDRVRHSHVRADGQVRAVGEMFDVGAVELEYPGDPSNLPLTAREVHGCRCGLLLSTPDDAFFAAMEDIAEAARADDDEYPPGVGPLFDAAMASKVFGEGPDIEGMPNLSNLTPLPEPVVGWRLLDAPVDAVPGQVVQLPAGTTLALAAPSELDPLTLAVRIPAGVVVGVADGTMVLPEGAVARVLADGQAGTQTTLF